MATFVLLLAFIPHLTGALQRPIYNMCRLPLNPLGCFAEYRYGRTLEVQILNARDAWSLVYSGPPMDYSDPTSLQKFVCRCVNAAISGGYDHFGVQFWGECWASKNNATSTDSYRKYGPTDTCYSSNYSHCSENDTICTGGRNTNFLYKIVYSSCTSSYYQVGCFNDRENARALPNLIMTSRSPKSSIYSGYPIDWKNWADYSSKFICDCAKKAKILGYKVFGIQYFGECWAGSLIDQYNKYGVSTECTTNLKDPCRSSEFNCVGKKDVSAVYQLL